MQIPKYLCVYISTETLTLFFLFIYYLCVYISAETLTLNPAPQTLILHIHHANA